MSVSDLPVAAVLIPARNEAASIKRCLEHVLSQDLPLDRLEVVVVDGSSHDGTAEAAESILAGSGLGRWRVHRNPTGTTPSNLNAGLALVRAPMVCRVDARSLIPLPYVRTCVELLDARPDVAVVGGAQMAVARSGSPRDRGIARALNNRYGMGLSRYRRGARSGPTDTVYLGAFRTTELRGAGGWDERLETNQDFDLNRRMSAYGKIWFDASLQVGYLPRSSVQGLWTQYHRFGRWKVRYWRETGDRPQRRQWVLMLGSSGMGLILLATCRLQFRRWLVALAVGVAGAALVDEVGSSNGGSLKEREVAAVSLGVVAAGWVAGVLREAVSGRG